jgi:hypothetical protein
MVNFYIVNALGHNLTNPESFPITVQCFKVPDLVWYLWVNGQVSNFIFFSSLGICLRPIF